MTTLADLLTTLETRGALPASRAKDCRTSIKYLAAALGAASPETCPVDAACRDPDRWGAALDTHFAALAGSGRTIGGTTRRNTRNNIRVVFRLAEAHGLLQAPLPPQLLPRPRRDLFKRQQELTTPYQSTYRPQTGPRHYGLPQAQWPPDIQEGWRLYRTKCGHRETTFKSYANYLTTYLGYIRHVADRQPVWEDLFDVPTLAAFHRWHATRLQRRSTCQARRVGVTLAAMARALEHPHAPALADWLKGLPPVVPMHTKRLHWVSLAQLEEVAEACLAEGRLPLVFQKDVRCSGTHRASRFQVGLILKLLVRIPLRQRNVRELRRNQHLYQEQDGDWWLHLQGDDLKIGERQGQVNEYKVNLTKYCPEILPLLEEFRTVFRPRFPGAATSPYLFLTHTGRPFTDTVLREALSCTVAMRTGKRFYPHLIRTIWATEHLKATQDYATAATMLGDTLAMAIKTYYNIVHEEQQAKAKAFLTTALQGG
jgi:integrase